MRCRWAAWCGLPSEKGGACAHALQGNPDTIVKSVSSAAAQEIFAEGDRVRCMLLGMDEGFSRISLSTADMERQPGDMLFDRVRAPVKTQAPCTHGVRSCTHDEVAF